MKAKFRLPCLVLLAAAGAQLPATAETPDEKPMYDYHPEGTAVVARDGDGRFNRPLYSSVQRPWRMIAVAGDRPEFMLMHISKGQSMTRLSNVKLGLADGPWLDTVTPVRARYDRGHQDYLVGEPDTGIEIATVRAREFDGLLLRVKIHGNSPAPLVLAIGGKGASTQYGRNHRDAAFRPEHCDGSELNFADNILTLAGKGIPLVATGSVPLRYSASDPRAVENGPKALLDAPLENNAIATLTAAWPESRAIYFIISPDAADSKGVQAFRANPAKVFDEAVEDNRRLAMSIEIDTPDPYLNAALPSAILNNDAAWNAPSFRHGAVAWHDPYAGWRLTYAATTAGWHDRVQTHMHAFYGKQKDGRIPARLDKDQIYNMNEVLVDQALYDYEWTGDLTPLENGGFDAIAAHLAWGEKHMKTPDKLYENFLNAWNTDYKWSNGGGGTIASTYYWRANKTMAEIAVRLGKDPNLFQTRAEEIAAAMKSELWSERAGVYGEYRDRFGHKLLHESPDMSSIYTPIDLGFADPFESYRMSRFALRNFGTIRGLPRDGALWYTSEWLPNHYSTRGLWTAETCNTLLALYRIGMSDAAEPYRRAIDGSFFAGPWPGSSSMTLGPDGTGVQYMGFADTTTAYVRNVVEGLFGIRMRAPQQRVILQPSFPLEWKHASIRCPAVGYQYTWDGTTESMAIQTSGDLMPTVRLRARTADIKEVTINGKQADYEVEPGIGVAWIVVNAPSGTASQVTVTYGDEPLPEAVAPEQGVAGGTCTVRVDRGRIESVRRSKATVEKTSISGNGRECSFPLRSEAGVATYFALARHHDVRLWLPLEIEVQAAGLANTQPENTDEPVRWVRTIDLGKHVNQRLADLHRNQYKPLVDTFYWDNIGGLRTVRETGRIWWEGRGRIIDHDTAALTTGNGRFVADNGIPFAVPAEGKDAVFTSMYPNFPDRIEIPVNQRGRKVAVLVAASIPIMQSRMDNGRIRVNLEDGSHRDLILRNPETIDDWLGSGTGKPYALGGHPVALGKNTHAHLYEIDLGGDGMVKSVELETFTNETLIGLLGITVKMTVQPASHDKNVEAFEPRRIPIPPP